MMQKLIWTLLILLATGACQRTEDPSTEGKNLSVSRLMSTQAEAGFARADSIRNFDFPRDHGPHHDYATEWWYFTGNLKSKAGRRFGYQLTLFRVALKPPSGTIDSIWRGQQIYMGHMAISDIEQRQHYSEERFSRAAAGLAGAGVPPLKVWLGPWTIEGAPDSLFPLRLSAMSDQMAINLTLSPGLKPKVLQGDRGLSKKGSEAGNASYYYSYTRLLTQGEIRVDEQLFEVTGNSWFDREWSSSALDSTQQGWDWFSLQLDDGRDLMFYRMRGIDGKAQRFSSGVLVDAGGQVEKLNLDNTRLRVLTVWSNPVGIKYPIDWSLQIPHHQIDLSIRAAFKDQEMRHSVHYWEGAVDVSGSHSGSGYMELSGYVQ